MDKDVVSLIVFTLNEIEGMRVIMPQIKKEWYDELIVIDGGSTDGTIEYCKEHDYPVHLQKIKKGGLTAGQLEVLPNSKGDIIIIFGPDGNSMPELIPQLVNKIREGYDMVIASRYLAGAKSYDDDFFTAIGNKVFTTMVNILFGTKYTDVLNLFRAYRRDAIEKMKLHKQHEENWLRRHYLEISSWEVGGAIRAKKLGLRVAEIPGDEPKRIGGRRKLTIIKAGMGVLLNIIYEFVTGMRHLR